MLNTIKELFDEILVLPKAVKIAVSIVLLFAVSFAVYFGIKNWAANLQINRLEKLNSELNAQAQTAQEKAAKAERNAADEALRAQNLESQLKTLEAKEKLTDVKIQTQSKTSDNLRLSLNRVRVSAPANISTDELEQRLCARYGCREKSGN